MWSQGLIIFCGGSLYEWNSCGFQWKSNVMAWIIHQPYMAPLLMAMHIWPIFLFPRMVMCALKDLERWIHVLCGCVYACARVRNSAIVPYVHAYSTQSQSQSVTHTPSFLLIFGVSLIFSWQGKLNSPKLNIPISHQGAVFVHSFQMSCWFQSQSQL